MQMRVQKLFAELLQDVRYALRQMRQSPSFALTIVATFAIGIAANAVSFSVMDAIVLRPLAVPDLNRVVTVAEQHDLHQDVQYPSPVSYADYEQYRQGSHTLTELAARTESSMTLTGNAQAERLNAMRATSNTFHLYRIEPMLGRTFSGSDASSDGHEEEAVLTHAFWKTHFGGRPQAVGEPLELDGKRYTVVGVMPQSFDHVAYTDVWLPLILSPTERNDRTHRNYMLTGRLKNGVTVAQSLAELNATAAIIARQYPLTNAGWAVRVRPLVETINGTLTPIFTSLIVAATMLLMLVVAVNISNLQFARTIRRSPELALRCALGSSRGRVMRQLLVENVTYSLLGVIAGLLLARVYLHVTVISMPQQVSRFLAGWGDIRLNTRTLGYSIGVAVAAGLFAGFAPAIAGMRVNLLEQLKAGGRSVSGSASAHRLRNLFAGAQIMLATVLIASATLIAASMYTMLHAVSRFDPEHALIFNVSLPKVQYKAPVQQAAFVADSLRRLRALPGVRNAEFTSALPYNNQGVWWQDLDIVGDPALPGQSRTTQRITVSPDFVGNLHLPLLQGRYLTASDTGQSPRVAVVSQILARQYFGDRNPIGQHIRMGKGTDATEPATVVGIVGDVVYTWTDQVPRPAVYFSINQFPVDSGTYVLRSESDPTGLTVPARQALAAVDRTVPIDSVETYAQFLHESLIGLWYMAAMLAIDAVIALFLCALGIFSVMANLVTERTQEIGIRFALGADRWSVTALMLRRGLLVVVLGLGTGTAFAYEADRLLAGILQGVHSYEMQILLGSTVAVALISVLAGYLPARRAASVSPTTALQAQ